MSDEAGRSAQDAGATGAQTEEQMRVASVPTFDEVSDLAHYIEQLAARPHDYGTCVYAMSMAAVAAYNYIARQLGVSGFQASCADMDILRRLRGLRHGFRIVDFGLLLYPQYWEGEQAALVPLYLEHLRDPDNAQHYAEEAQLLLAEHRDSSEQVRQHWESLVRTYWTPTPRAPALP